MNSCNIKAASEMFHQTEALLFIWIQEECNILPDKHLKRLVPDRRSKGHGSPPGPGSAAALPAPPAFVTL